MKDGTAPTVIGKKFATPSPNGTTPVKATNAPDKFSTTPSKTPSTPGNTPMKGFSLYERSLLHKAATESKLKQLESSMMEQFTFTPDTSKPKVSKKTPDSLHKNTTPNKSNVQNSPCKSPVRSPLSSRVDELYRDGVRKNQERRMTAKEEGAARDRRLQDRDLAQCTFRPNLDWKVKKPANPEDLSVGSTKAARPVKLVDHPKTGMAVSPLSHPDVE